MHATSWSAALKERDHFEDLGANVRKVIHTGLMVHGNVGAPKGGWLPGYTNAPKRNLKNTDFVDTILWKVSRDLRFSLNQSLKSADE
jgi:hypothetical protein